MFLPTGPRVAELRALKGAYVNRHAGLVRPGAPPMSETAADPPDPDPESRNHKRLVLIPRRIAHDAHGRFAKKLQQLGRWRAAFPIPLGAFPILRPAAEG
jgi:hypothetical protein